VNRFCASLFLLTLLLGGAVTHAAGQGDRMSLYGFFDFEVGSNDQVGGPAWTFDQHHLNVVSIYRLDDRWRVFAEVEWEHGPDFKTSGTSGAIILERAVVEYKHSDALQLKIGKFLTPFGLYNLRHDASPAFFSTSLPDAVYGAHANTLRAQQRLFAKVATGLQVLGSVLGRSWALDYYLYISNGRGSQPASADNNSNKGIGGRLAVSVLHSAVQLGASYYADRNGTAAQTRQQTVAMDATVHYADFLMEAEMFVPRLERVDLAGRPDGSFRIGRGYYVQVSHPLLERWTPFGRYGLYDPDTGAPGDAERSVVVGLNFAATGAVFFKTEVQLRSFQDPALASYRVWLGSVAVAF